MVRADGPMKVDASIIVATIGRESLWRTVQSVFRQTHPGILQILIGVDAEWFQPVWPMVQELMREMPRNVFITPINLGYSTSVRHGGVHTCRFGGSLRTALSFLAASEHITYLDDDDWCEPEHIRLLLAAVQGHSWAFTLSNYADPNTGAVLGIDTIESVGPGRGIYKETLGGFVRPSALLLNKLKLAHILHLWSVSPYRTGDEEDRLVFGQLLKVGDYGQTGVPTLNCCLDPGDKMHDLRMKSLGMEGRVIQPKLESMR